MVGLAKIANAAREPKKEASRLVGHTGNAGQIPYTMVKAGLDAFVKSLAQELAASNVTTNCIGPAGLTRITATMPGAGEAFEPDPYGFVMQLDKPMPSIREALRPGIA